MILCVCTVQRILFLFCYHVQIKKSHILNKYYNLYELYLHQDRDVLLK